MRGYNNHPSDKSAPTLSNIIEEQLNSAVLNQHKKGLSNKAIARLFNLSGHTAVARILERLGGSPKENLSFSDPIALPMVNTEDRSETRVDADEFVDDFLSEYDDYISLAEDEADAESAPAPTFDLKAATGFGDDIANYTKREKAEDAAPWADTKQDHVKLQEAGAYGN